jgi:hypothetical protein
VITVPGGIVELVDWPDAAVAAGSVGAAGVVEPVQTIRVIIRLMPDRVR